ncbi:MAG: extensin family protein [Polyangiaceae bacterium]|nr:extensin family protein [Polyangiaceae bacterium]
MRLPLLVPLAVLVLSGCLKSRHGAPAESSHAAEYAGYAGHVPGPDGVYYGPHPPYPGAHYHTPNGGQSSSSAPPGAYPAPYGYPPLAGTPYSAHPPQAQPEGAPAQPPAAPPGGAPMDPLPAAPPPGAEPALRYAALSGPDCLAEAARRGLPIEQVPARASLSAVQTPVRLTGPLGDVLVVMNGSQRPGAMGDYDILDCRLALAVSDLARLLAARGVTTIHHASLLRQGAVVRSTGKPSQHAMGLAIDVARLSMRDGSQVVVKRDFPADIGAPVCVPREDPAQRWLRGVVCEAHQARLFNLILTPNFNADHHDHLHLDLAPGKAWFNLR